jgi:hypothetical protein
MVSAPATRVVSAGGRNWFNTSRVACHGFNPCASWSGKRAGSAAARNASSARIAEAMWCPWPAVLSGAKRVTMTSGR